jgi:hypothetical protein
MDKEKMKGRIDHWIAECENSIQELLAAEKEVKSYELNKWNKSIRAPIEETLERSKRARTYYVRQLGRLDRIKKRLESM